MNQPSSKSKGGTKSTVPSFSMPFFSMPKSLTLETEAAAVFNPFSTFSYGYGVEEPEPKSEVDRAIDEQIEKLRSNGVI